MMNEYLKNLSDFSYIKQRQGLVRIAINLAKKNIPHLKKVKSKNWSEILQYVLSNKVSNIVLILHASSSGRLFDADSNEIPHTFFLALNSVVQSVTVFSCHSKVIESYGMIGKVSFSDLPSSVNLTMVANGCNSNSVFSFICQTTTQFVDY